MSSALPWRRHVAVAGIVGLSCAALTACNTDSGEAGRATHPHSSNGVPVPGTSAGTDGVVETPAPVRPALSTNVRKGAQDVPVDTLVHVATDHGVLKSVSVSSAAGEVTGALAGDGLSWTASDRLEPGTVYTVSAVADDNGAAARSTSRFTTQALTLAQQTYPSVSPLAGQEVGVGMPVIVNFDVPVTDRASFEKNMHVTTSPVQKGSWHWLSDTTAHWRPATYFKPGTKVDVAVDVNGVDAGNGVYGQENRHVAFEVGDAHVYKVNAQTHQMRVFSNGRLLRTIPITTGKPGFTTRSGTKVIIEKFASKTMNSETVGITGSEAYNIDNVQWAMRLTYSGEFIHAAPWSVGSQGYANVSHGCTGMSTANAAWLYSLSRVGDVVEYTGTDRPMEFDNGYGDWNESYATYAKGSALS